mmetsp:Transcript_61936/g.195764  ORF Transcript_61936/g.195764 Transcript_61936/m.195764 type:complete len:211 (-) Transcript_61936:1244-1876(-)
MLRPSSQMCGRATGTSPPSRLAPLSSRTSSRSSARPTSRWPRSPACAPTSSPRLSSRSSRSCRTACPPFPTPSRAMSLRARPGGSSGTSSRMCRPSTRPWRRPPWVRCTRRSSRTARMWQSRSSAPTCASRCLWTSTSSVSCSATGPPPPCPRCASRPRDSWACWTTGRAALSRSSTMKTRPVTWIASAAPWRPVITSPALSPPPRPSWT